MEKRKHLQDLFQRYIDGTIDRKGLEELTDYVNSTGHDALWLEVLETYYHDSDRPVPDSLLQTVTPIVDESWRHISQQLDKQGPAKQTRTGRITKLYKYAAAVLLLLTLSGIWYYYYSDNADYDVGLSEVQDIHPGTNRATLSLSDGSTIALSEAQSGLVVDEGGIAYLDGTSILKTEKIQTATIITPRAGQYQVILPDGSKVWLNAATTLRYPTQFTGDERRVELEGEAYFEIKPLSSQRSKMTKQPISVPFIVASATQEVTVLGTQFNIKAYRDETAVQTTLVEGKVIVSTAQSSPLELSPGQQSNLVGQQLSLTSVNAEDHTAWKDGLIVLERQTIEEVLRQLERWYDVEFVYQNGPRLPGKTLSGEVLRSLPLSVLLQALEEQTNLTFERKERRIMVKD